jgi:hypothetical protein
MRVSGLRMIYLALAVWGAVHPTIYFVAWFRMDGSSINRLVNAWHANFATSGLVWDLTIAAIAFAVWVLAETYVRKNWSALNVIPVTIFVGLGCALPLYLFLRTRPVS